MKLKTHLATAIIAAVGGAWLYGQVRPPLKVVEVKEVVRQQTTTTTKRTKQKDGTIITEITKVKNTEKQKLKTEPTPNKGTTASLYVTVPLLSGRKQEIGLAVTKELLWGAHVFGSIQTDGQIGIGVGYTW